MLEVVEVVHKAVLPEQAGQAVAVTVLLRLQVVAAE
jgi:hypothetical protein